MVKEKCFRWVQLVCCILTFGPITWYLSECTTLNEDNITFPGCGFPGRPIKGKLSPDKDEFEKGDVVKAVCDSGNFIRGHEENECLGNLEWKYPIPTCEKNMAFKQQVQMSATGIEPVSRATNSVTVDGEIDKCADMKTNSGIIGSWWMVKMSESVSVSCVKLTLKLGPPDVAYFVSIETGNEFKAGAEFKPCRKPTEIKDNITEITCDENHHPGTVIKIQVLSSSRPPTKSFIQVCEIVVFPKEKKLCPHPGYPPSCIVNYNGSGQHNTKATYSVKQGFQMIGGNLTRICINGKWTGKAPICIPTTKGCKNTDNLHNYKLGTHNSNFAIGDKTEFYCQEGFEMTHGTKLATCTGNDQWNSLPTCERNVAYQQEIQATEAISKQLLVDGHSSTCQSITRNSGSVLTWIVQLAHTSCVSKTRFIGNINMEKSSKQNVAQLLVILRSETLMECNKIKLPSGKLFENFTYCHDGCVIGKTVLFTLTFHETFTLNLCEIQIFQSNESTSDTLQLLPSGNNDNLDSSIFMFLIIACIPVGLCIIFTIVFTCFYRRRKRAVSYPSLEGDTSITDKLEHTTRASLYSTHHPTVVIQPTEELEYEHIYEPIIYTELPHQKRITMNTDEIPSEMKTDNKIFSPPYEHLQIEQETAPMLPCNNGEIIANDKIICNRNSQQIEGSMAVEKLLKSSENREIDAEASLRSKNFSQQNESDPEETLKDENGYLLPITITVQYLEII